MKDPAIRPSRPVGTSRTRSRSVLGTSRTRYPRLGLALVAAAAGACSGSSSGPRFGTWGALLGAERTLPAGSEQYYCVRKTVQREYWVTGFRPSTNLGIHHTLLTLADGKQPDSSFECDGATNGTVVIFASGVGTAELDLPTDVALHVPAGSQLLLNLHLFNATTSPITTDVNIEFKSMDPTKVQQEAEVILAGKVDGLVVVPGMSTQTGTCTMPGSSKIYALMPHMHNYGIHMKATAHMAGGGTALLMDRNYNFHNQSYGILDTALDVQKDDKITVDCTYDNTSQQAVMFGPHSTDEMCYSMIYRYPKIGGPPVCTM